MGSCLSAPCPDRREATAVESRPAPVPASAETAVGDPHGVRASPNTGPPTEGLQMISVEFNKLRFLIRDTTETLPAGATTPSTSTKRTPYCLTKSLFDSLVTAPEDVKLQLPEQLLEDVELLHPVGAGSYGVVYKGQYLGAECAVKLVAIEASADNAHLHEALLSPQLRHPNVVHTYTARAALMTEAFVREVYSAGSSGSSSAGGAPVLALPAALTRPSGHILRQDSGDGLGPPQGRVRGLRAWSEAFARLAVKPGQVLVLLAQEFCTQGTLSTAVQSSMFGAQQHNGESFKRRVVLRTAAEICRGMMCLHVANVIHGDLKPGNILLAPSRSDRRGFVAKVADFGLSRVLCDLQSWADTSAPGTVTYSAPEALKGQQSKGSDVYSFGIVLYELMTGKRAFHNLTHARVMMGVCFEGLQPDWPEEQWPELCALAKRCCAPDRSQRPSFRQLERELVDMEAAVRDVRRQRRAGSSHSLPSTPVASGHSPRTESAGFAADAALSSSTGGGPPRNSSLTVQRLLGGAGRAAGACRSRATSVTAPGEAKATAPASPSHTTLLGAATSALLRPQ